MNQNVNEELLAFLKESVTAFQAVNALRRCLNENGYEELTEGKQWQLKEGGKYFTVRNESSIIAFRIPEEDFAGFMIGASHSDSPAFKIKANPEIKENGYIRLNVEKYGGALLSPWFDRPLSVAGRVIVRENGTFVTKYVNLKKDQSSSSSDKFPSADVTV